MLTEEEVLSQAAWDICRGFLNVQSGDRNMVSVQNVGAPLANTVFWLVGMLIASRLFHSPPAGLASHSQSQLSSNTPVARHCPFPAPKRRRISLHSPPLHGALADGGLKGPVENRGEYCKRQESATKIWIQTCLFWTWEQQKLWVQMQTVLSRTTFSR